MKKEELIDSAKRAREHAYVPYSSFKVGAALLTTSNKVYSGSNVENASYPLSCCAERTAIFKAITEGEQDFSAMAVIADSEGPISPCGACRQVMAEFFPNDMPIHLANIKGDVKTVTITELLPFHFQLKNDSTN